ncbi:hypothetical protein [uncultured Aquimarina sp.]|uniref:hypothetical protein n=1 Tax=uncultured Aquimarina sp. TaxID=575652 RepID=UPI0026172028|nr:hypothetical protein [uncultured Aquimarina sp.]
MRRSGKIIVIILSVVVIFFLLATWYKYEYSMEEAKAFQLNDPTLDQKLLIATQGSEFKDSITSGLVRHYKSDAIFIKVIDISSLEQINPENYTAMVLIHTWENWKPPYVVRLFIERTADYRDKTVVLTTSGEGAYQMKEVDAITGESNLEEAPVFINKIIDKLDMKLQLKN